MRCGSRPHGRARAGTVADVSASFIGHYLFALLVIALLLFGLRSMVRRFARWRLIAQADKRIVTVVESTFVAPSTTLHIVKIADKYYALGGGSGRLVLLCEIPASAVTPWGNPSREVSPQEKSC